MRTLLHVSDAIRSRWRKCGLLLVQTPASDTLGFMKWPTSWIEVHVLLFHCSIWPLWHSVNICWTRKENCIWLRRHSLKWPSHQWATRCQVMWVSCQSHCERLVVQMHDRMSDHGGEWSKKTALHSIIQHSSHPWESNTLRGPLSTAML